MEQSLKKLSIALFALGMSGVASAAMYTPPAPVCTGKNVVVPCEKTGWRIGGSILYGEQTNDDRYYANASSVGYVEAPADNWNAVNFRTQEKNIGERYRWGFDLFGAYTFRQGHELLVRWTRIHNSTNDSHAYSPYGVVTNGVAAIANQAVVLNTRYFGGLLGNNSAANVNFGSGGERITAVAGEASTDFDQVDAELAQFVHMGDFVNTRLFFGVSYVRLDDDITSSAYSEGRGYVENAGVVSEAIWATASYRADDKSEFDGVGPSAGLSTTWELTKTDKYSVGISGSARTALLIGDLENKTHVSKGISYNSITNASVAAPGVDTNQDAATGTLTQDASSEDVRTVVPELAGSIALTGTYKVGESGMIRGDLGWKAMGVYHAKKHAVVAGDNNVSYVISNYGYHGPFLTLQYIA